MIKGGHDHFVTVTKGNGNLVVKSGEDFQHFHVIRVFLERDQKPRIECTTVPITKQYSEDPELLQMVEHYQKVMASKMGKIVAVADVALDAGSENVRTREANIGNFTFHLFHI